MRKASFFVYVLGSRRQDDRRTYVGWTTDLARRLERHNAGKGAKSTKGRQWVLLHSERCKTRNEAMSREWYIKRDRKFRAALREKIGLRDAPSANRRQKRFKVSLASS
jgi:putative endonuclease